MSTTREEMLKDRIRRRVLANQYPWHLPRIGQVRALEEGAVYLLSRSDKVYLGLIVSPDFAYDVKEFGTVSCLTVKNTVIPYCTIPISPMAGYIHLWSDVNIHRDWLKNCLADFSCSSTNFVIQEKEKEFDKSLPVNLTVKHLQNNLIDKWLSFNKKLKSMEA